MIKKKQIWISEELHTIIKTGASSQGKMMDDYLRSLTENVKIDVKPVPQSKNKWRVI